MKIIKKKEDLDLERRYKLELFIKNKTKEFFADSNKCHSFADFCYWPHIAMTRNELIMPGEICVIDRMWEGKHTYVVCEFYGKNGDKVHDLFPVVKVDELNRADWRNGYFLIPDLKDVDKKDLGGK